MKPKLFISKNGQNWYINWLSNLPMGPSNVINCTDGVEFDFSLLIIESN